jgi:hypothetical protein
MEPWGEDAVRDGGIHGTGAPLDELVGRAGEGAGGDREVVDDERGLAAHLADDLEGDGALVVRRALLAHDGDGGAEQGGELACMLHEAAVGRDHDEVGQLHAADPLAQHGQRVEHVHGDAEEALDLGCVQVERDDPVGAGGLDGVGADAGADGDPGLVLFLSPLA